MDFAASLQRRMLLGYLGVLLVLYLFSVVSAWDMDSARGEILSVALSVVGLAAAARAPLGFVRYVVAVACLCAVPVAAMLFHDVDAAQVWAVVPLMFSAIYVRAWHRPATARMVATAIAVAAGVALAVAPADVPAQWYGMFAVCIVAGAEIVGVLLAALYDAALRDPLTGAWNRTGLERRAAELMSRAGRRAELLAVIALDVDDFKVLNDRAGHAAGDRVLAQLVHDWGQALPDRAVLGRLGGDEFTVVLAGHDEERARDLAQKLATAGPVRVSAGTAVGQPVDQRTLEALMARADRELYRVKRQRKGAA
ncbi:MAG: GGDEF domain-containing protein [Mycobacterium kyogaense]|uniref:GGDEF domain-containing protein n=1 Tax=Mycobacterium kyogaense TaxID=2212479 RepID=UPI002FF741BB